MERYVFLGKCLMFTFLFLFYRPVYASSDFDSSIPYDIATTQEAMGEQTTESVPQDIATDKPATQDIVSEDAIREDILDDTDDLVGAMVPIGFYYISAREFMVCIKGNQQTAGANIQLGTYATSNVRLFALENAGDGTYYIQNPYAKLYLSLDKTGNVVLGEKTKWTLIKEEAGTFRFVNGKRTMTVTKAQTGANLYTDTKTANIQSFSLISAKKMVNGGGSVCTYQKEVEQGTDVPDLKLTVLGTELVKDVDYSLTTNIGNTSGKFTIKGMGEYAGSRTETFCFYSYPLEEGLYRISDGSSMVSIKGNQKGNGVNVQLGTSAASNVRLFFLEKQDLGYYRIKNMNTGKYLATDTSGNVIQNSSGKTNWRINAGGDGYYLQQDGKYMAGSSGNVTTDSKGTKWRFLAAKKYITGGCTACTYQKRVEKGSPMPKIALSVFGSELTENTDYNVTYGENGTITLTGIGDYTGVRKESCVIYTYPLPDGIYRIYAANVAAKPMFSIKGNTLNEGGNVQLGSNAASNARLFYLQRAGDGYYHIRNMMSDKYLSFDSSDANSNIYQGLPKKWFLTPVKNGYHITASDGGKYLSAVHSTTGSNICLAEKNTGVTCWAFTETKMYVTGGVIAWNHYDSIRYDPDTGSYESPHLQGVLFGNKLKSGQDFKVTYATDPENGIGWADIEGIGNYTGKTTIRYRLDESGLCGWYRMDTSVLGNRYLFKYGDYTVNKNLVLQNEENLLSGISFIKSGAGCLLNAWVQNTGLVAKGNSVVMKEGKSDIWYPVKNGSGTAILHTGTGFALTAVEGAVVLRPYRELETQRFRLVKAPNTASPVGSPTLPDTDTYLSDYRYDWAIRLDDTETTAVFTKEGSRKDISGANSGIVCDFKNERLCILSGFINYSESVNILSSVSIKSLDPKVGNVYILSMERKNKFAMTATLTDLATGAKVEAKYTRYGAGRGWGRVKTRINGRASVLALRGYSTKNTDCKLCVMGDSYAEGASLRDDYTKSFACLMGEDSITSSKGGATSADGVIWLKDYLLEISTPQYMVLEFGMNDTNYDIWKSNMKSMIDSLYERGIEPVLCTIPPATANSKEMNSLHHRMSDWVRKSGYKYLDFEYIMSVSHDRITPHAEQTLSDGIHPTAQAHQETVTRFLNQYQF